MPSLPRLWRYKSVQTQAPGTPQGPRLSRDRNSSFRLRQPAAVGAWSPPPFPARGCRTPGSSRKAWSIPNPGSSKVPGPWKTLPKLGWRRPFGKRYLLAFIPFGIRGKTARGEMEKDAGATEMQASYPVHASGLPAQVFFAQDAGSKPLPSRQRICGWGGWVGPQERVADPQLLQDPGGRRQGNNSKSKTRL